MDTLDRIDTSATSYGLMLMGALHDQAATLVLLGAGKDFWTMLQRAPEFGADDPVDRYSERALNDLASQYGATPRFPFGGPPYEPFIAWAKASGRAWSSPTGMLVHDTAGLMISYRGALQIDGLLPLPDPPAQSPCTTCDDRPCTDACPVGALSGSAPYDVPACHAFLDTDAGRDCMEQGCKARRACPVSQSFARDPGQSAHHMRSFHPT